MARLIISGNELGDYQGEGWFDENLVPDPVVNQVGGRRTFQNNGGNYYFYVISTRRISKAIGSTLSEGYIRLAYGANDKNTTAGGNGGMLRFKLGSVIVASVGTADIGGNNSSFQLYNGNNTLLASGGSVQTINQGAVGPNGFLNPRLEFHIKLGGAGAFDMRVNGSSVLSFSGSVTGPGGETTFDTISIGSSRGNQYYYDDIAFNDTTGTINNSWVGDGVILAIFPNNVGSNSQLNNSGASHITNNHVDNYNFVNRLPVNALVGLNNNAQSVGTTVVNSKDTYRLSILPEEANTISAFKVSVCSVKNGPTISHLKTSVIPPAQAEILLPAGPGLSLPVGGFGWVEQIYDSNPNTGLAFTVSEINGMEAGLQFLV